MSDDRFEEMRKQRQEACGPPAPATVNLWRPSGKWRPERRPQVSFYDTPAWLELRYRALKLHSGQCQCCGNAGHGGNPLQVDHIKPRSRFPELEMDLNNLQVLCKACNQGKGAWDQTDWRHR